MTPSDFGSLAACVANNVAPQDFETVKGAALRLSAGLDGEAFGKQIATLAYEIFEKAGHAGSFEAQLYGQLAKTANWQQFHHDLLVPVYSALAKFDESNRAETHEKNATALVTSALGGLARLFPQALAASPGMLFGTMGLLGATGGGLNWALNRAANGTDAQSAAMEGKIDYYDSLRREIEDELRRNPPPELRDAMRKKLDDAEEPGYAL